MSLSLGPRSVSRSRSVGRGRAIEGRAWVCIWRMLSVSTSEVLKHDKAPRKRSSGVPCRRGRVAVSRGRKCGTRVPLAPYALHKYTYIASHARARRVCGPLSRDTGIARVARCGHGSSTHGNATTIAISPNSDHENVYYLMVMTYVDLIDLPDCASSLLSQAKMFNKAHSLYT